MKTIKSAEENLSKYIESDSAAPAPERRGRKPKIAKIQELLNSDGGCTYTEVLERERKYLAEKESRRVKMTPAEQVRKFLGDVDDVIDELFSRKKKVSFNLVKWMLDKNFTEEHADIIEGIYKKQKEEIDEMIEGNDPDLKEAYSFLNSYQKKMVQDFYQNLLDQCGEFLGMRRRKKAFDRKPHVVKPMTAAKQVKDLKFKKEDTDFKLVSVSPEYIVGASEVWVFNTKYRYLSRYCAKDAGGFKIKGCALQNWDEKRSSTKTLRKPDETLKVVLEGKRKALDGLMDSLTTKPAPTNGRFNGNIIILKVQK
jgi:hypothetical protein